MNYSLPSHLPPAGYVVALTLSVGDELFCRLGGGTPALLKGTVLFLDDERVIVETDGPSMLYAINRRTMKDRDGDYWFKQAPAKTEWLNVYADGTVGRTAHDSWEDAVDRSQYGKTRVGILEREVRGGCVKSARVHPTTPQLRTPEQPGGYNPYA